MASAAPSRNAGPEPTRHTVVLADDHPSIRRGLKRLLDSLQDFEIVGEAGNGQDALDLVMRVRPALLICDLSMPGMHGLELTRAVCAAAPATRVVILTVQADEPYVLRGLEAGASGYVLKSASADHLLIAIRAAMNGERYLSPPLPASLLERGDKF